MVTWVVMHMRSTQSRSTTRDASLDNAKAILIVLVLLGHATEDVPKDDLIEAIYRVIYQFHMPAFALITGYLSRRFKVSFGSYLKLIGALAVPYLIFQVGHAALDGWLEQRPMDIDLLNPEWTLWYLVAVFFWRAATPILRALPLAIPISILVALGFGMLPDLTDTLAFDRTITLLPFFVIGLTLTPEVLDRVRRIGVIPLTIIGVPMLVTVAVWSMDRLGGDDFWFSRTFAQVGDASMIYGLLLRLASYVLGLIGTAWVLSIAPRRKLPVTYIGVQSLYAYLLHSVVFKPFKEDGVIEGLDEPWLLIASVALAVGAAAVFTSKPVTMITQYVIQPPFASIKLPIATPNPELQAGWARRAIVDENVVYPSAEAEPRRAAEKVSVGR